jgi:putative membrane protein
VRRGRGRGPALVVTLGTLIALVAVAPPVDERADSSLAVHMLQHLTLVFAAAPLLAWAGSALVLSSRLGGRAVALLDRAPLRLAASPAAGWLALTAVMTVTHVPAVFDMVERHPPLHAGEHAAYLLAGVLFWRPALGPEGRGKLPRTLRLPYLVAAMPAGDLVGMWLVTRGAPAYAAYGEAAGEGQRAAGAEMIAASFVLALVGVREAWGGLTREQRRAEVTEHIGARVG